MRRIAGVIVALLGVMLLAVPALAEEVEAKTEGEFISISFSKSEYELTTTNNAWVKVEFRVTPSRVSYHAKAEDFKVDVHTVKPLKADLVRIKESEEEYNVFTVTFHLESGLLSAEKSKNAAYTVTLTPVGEHRDLLAKGSYRQEMRVKYQPFDSYSIQEALDTMWMERRDYGFAYANAGYLPGSVIRMLKMELEEGQSMNVDFGGYGVVFTYDMLTDLKAQAIDLYASTEEHTGYAKRIEEAGFTGEVSYLKFKEQSLTAPLRLYVGNGMERRCIYTFDPETERFSRCKLTHDGQVYTIEAQQLATYVITEKPLPEEIADPSTLLFAADENRAGGGKKLLGTGETQEEAEAGEPRIYKLKDGDTYYRESTALKIQRYIK